MTEIEVWFPQDMIEEIEAIIAETGESFSDFVARAIDSVLDELDQG